MKPPPWFINLLPSSKAGADKALVLPPFYYKNPTVQGLEALYRAYYHSYNRGRLIYETSLEQHALGMLRDAGRTGSLLALRQAEEILDRPLTAPVSQDKRQRIFELAEATADGMLLLSFYRESALGGAGRGNAVAEVWLIKK